jgi:hypothetical protein
VRPFGDPRRALLLGSPAGGYQALGVAHLEVDFDVAGREQGVDPGEDAADELLDVRLLRDVVEGDPNLPAVARMHERQRPFPNDRHEVPPCPERDPSGQPHLGGRRRDQRDALDVEIEREDPAGRDVVVRRAPALAEFVPPVRTAPGLYPRLEFRRDGVETLRDPLLRLGRELDRGRGRRRVRRIHALVAVLWSAPDPEGLELDDAGRADEPERATEVRRKPLGLRLGEALFERARRAVQVDVGGHHLEWPFIGGSAIIANDIIGKD